ncbi:MAG TPA: hypothetical protein VNZ22_20800, partial [Bacillota bacterium]|nr:hypothetical protein [Bacillota bacterium]
FDTLTITSNAPSATSLGSALDTARYLQPGQHFRELGDLLAVPELTVASPWLNWTNTIQRSFGISDAAYEMLPSQLLPRLRPDSVASVLSIGANVHLQFTGLDDYDYAVEVSPDLVTWTAVSTNRPSHGSFQFVEPTPPNSPQRFYRSVLLP